VREIRVHPSTRERIADALDGDPIVQHPLF
jgi:hypothetical protein